MPAGCENGKPVPIHEETYRKAAEGLAAAGHAAYKAAQSRSLDAMVEVSETVSQACANCHEPYRDFENPQDDARRSKPDRPRSRRRYTEDMRLPRASRVLVLAVLVAAAVGALWAIERQTPSGDPAAARRDMVERQIRARGVSDARVLAALGTVPRERFVPDDIRARAYDDSPLPIGHGQTISQPYIVAYMTEALGLEADDTVLEIGTGSGYQAAVLGELARTVYTIEIVPELAQRAAATLQDLGYANVHVRAGDGYAGWPEHAPFDRIMVTAAPEAIPAPLLEQLAPGGRLVIPVGEQGQTQWMTIADKTDRGVVSRRTIPVQFVPFTRPR